MGLTSEEIIVRWTDSHKFRALSEIAFERACKIRDINLKAREVMLVLSSDDPIEASHINAGPESVIFLGHMSATAVRIVLEIFGLKFIPNEKGVYKVIFQPEHSKL